MLSLSADQVAKGLEWPQLIQAIKAQFVEGGEVPLRSHFTLPVSGEADATLLIMPAWMSDHYIGVKMATVFPGNRQRGMASISAVYILASAKTGEMLAMIEGGELTARRTVAASALAASYLAHRDAKHLLIVGTGRLSRLLPGVYASVRDIEQVTIWGRSSHNAEKAAVEIQAMGFAVRISDSLEEDVEKADIISTVTLSEEPLIKGEWLSPGCHLDLIGSFRPHMREVDDAVMRRARVFCDSRDFAPKESGDLAIPLREGVITLEDICGDLFDLTKDKVEGRQSDDEITLFKSVGHALEDLAAARHVYNAYKYQP